MQLLQEIAPWSQVVFIARGVLATTLWILTLHQSRKISELLWVQYLPGKSLTDTQQHPPQEAIPESSSAMLSVRGGDSGILEAPGHGNQNCDITEIDLSAFDSGGMLLIDITLWRWRK
ncbi:MAG: hypothetical protein M2R45_02529 [Verrucomicrobia subdivision 3 bacterium]|nr:hypothetical protein [Limisphaerales bacterium]MCS1414263.1 hypothetical protein [Limisphaerales bacterium]